MPPVISSIIPVHNAAPWLPRCLDSICGQTLDTLEIICVDDGSDDDSGAIIKEYARRDSRVFPITLGRNRGVSVARNIGLGVAQGEWLSFVDSDDSLALDFYEKLYVASLEGDAEIIKGTCWDERDHPKYIDPNINAQIESDKFKFDSRWLTAIYNNKFIKEHRIFFPINCSHNEDFVFLYAAILNATKVKLVNEAIYNKFHIESSLSSSPATVHVINHILVARNIILDLLNKNINLIGISKYIIEYSRIIIPLFIYVHKVRHEDKDAASLAIAGALKEYFKKCHDPELLAQELKRYDEKAVSLITNSTTKDLAAYLALTQFERLRNRTRHRMQKRN